MMKVIDIARTLALLAATVSIIAFSFGIKGVIVFAGLYVLTIVCVGAWMRSLEREEEE